MRIDEAPRDTVRTWKRDGSENRMSAFAAATNIRRSAADAAVREESVAAIALRLRAGERFETRHALFHFEGA